MRYFCYFLASITKNDAEMMQFDLYHIVKEQAQPQRRDLLRSDVECCEIFTDKLSFMILRGVGVVAMRDIDNPEYIIGDYLRKHRLQHGLSISELGRISGVSKAVISNIESNGTKKPKLSTMKALATALQRPMREVIEIYTAVETRVDLLVELLVEAIETGDADLSRKLAFSILQSPREDTIQILETLYLLAIKVEHVLIKLEIFDAIIHYAKEHGVLSYLAKGLFQRYLIERNDFTKLKETYLSGKNILFYENFLSHDDKLLLHYKLGVHAYNLGAFQECIDISMYILDNDPSPSRLKADATVAIYNSYYHLNDFHMTEKYLHFYRALPFPDVNVRAKFMEAALKGKRGEIDAAITEFKECLTQADKTLLLHVMNQLIEIYLTNNLIDEIDHLLHWEDQIKDLRMETPFKKAQLAHYYKLKGDYLAIKSQYHAAIDAYIYAANEYAVIDFSEHCYAVLQTVLTICLEKSSETQFFTLQKLLNMYNGFIKGKEGM